MTDTPQATLLYLQRKVQAYTLLSSLFLVIGAVIFVDLYNNNIRGQLFEALRDLKTIGIFILPFFPGLILSAMASKTRKKYESTLAKFVSEHQAANARR